MSNMDKHKINHHEVFPQYEQYELVWTSSPLRSKFHPTLNYIKNTYKMNGIYIFLNN